jgi:hypothetical protein
MGGGVSAAGGVEAAERGMRGTRGRSARRLEAENMLKVWKVWVMGKVLREEGTDGLLTGGGRKAEEFVFLPPLHR